MPLAEILLTCALCPTSKYYPSSSLLNTGSVSTPHKILYHKQSPGAQEKQIEAHGISFASVAFEENFLSSEVVGRGAPREQIMQEPEAVPIFPFAPSQSVKSTLLPSQFTLPNPICQH